MRFLGIIDPNSNISIGKAFEIALICMLIVFGILVLIWGAVSLFKYIRIKGHEDEDDSNDESETDATESAKPEIKDDQMMAAVLAATIEFTNETKTDAKLVSVKKVN